MARRRGKATSRAAMATMAAKNRLFHSSYIHTLFKWLREIMKKCSDDGNISQRKRLDEMGKLGRHSVVDIGKH